MRSLLISGSYFPPQVGGIATMMKQVCASLGKEHVAVLTGVPGNHDQHCLEGIRIYRAEYAIPPRTWKESIRTYACLGVALARERPSVLQYASLEDAHLAYWTHKALRLKHVLYAHGNEILAATKSTWAKGESALLASSCVVANSRYTESLLRNLNVPAERIRIVHPGCDVEHFRRVPVSADDRARLTGGRKFDRLLLTVGNLVERKGHDMVIRALGQLSKSAGDVLYLIAGEGRHRPHLERLAASVGAADRVVFLGRVPTSDLPMLYSLADVFVMMSRDRTEHDDVEGFGIVFLEAAACGTPAIGGLSGGIEDAVVNGETGILVDPCDVGAIAGAMSDLFARPDLLARLGEAARRRAVSQFDWSRFGNDIESILRGVAGEPRRRVSRKNIL